jgi:hypothetical protein
VITFLRAVAWLMIVVWGITLLSVLVTRADPLEMLKLAMAGKTVRVPLWLILAMLISVLFLWNVH